MLLAHPELGCKAGRPPALTDAKEQQGGYVSREKVAARNSALWGRNRVPAEEEDLPPEEFLSKEVDPILDKISAHGIQSLTPKEREILEAARAKMEKR